MKVLREPRNCTAFWLWAATGVAGAFATISFAGPLAWPIVAFAVGALTARSMRPVAATVALVVAVAAAIAAIELQDFTPLVPATLATWVAGLWPVGPRAPGAVVRAALAVGGVCAVAAGLVLVVPPLLVHVVLPLALVAAAIAIGGWQPESWGLAVGVGAFLAAVGFLPSQGLLLALAGLTAFVLTTAAHPARA